MNQTIVVVYGGTYFKAIDIVIYYMMFKKILFILRFGKIKTCKLTNK